MTLLAESLVNHCATPSKRACAAVRPGGHLIIATFAEDGPRQCSGLPVMRYDAAALSAEFAAATELANLFAVVVERNRATALAFESPAFAISHVAARRTGMSGAVLSAGLIRQITQSDHHRNRSGIEVREMNVRSFAGVIEGDATTAAQDSFR